MNDLFWLLLGATLATLVSVIVSRTRNAAPPVDEQDAIEEVVPVWFPARMSLRTHAAPLEDRGVVVVLQDVTQELLTQRIRREFASSASHELKSPIASI